MPAAEPFLARVRQWHVRANERHELARMSPRYLHDIGVDWQAVRREAAKPFWRA